MQFEFFPSRSSALDFFLHGQKIFFLRANREAERRRRMNEPEYFSSSAIEKELQLKTIQILKIENIKMNRTLSIISNPEGYRSKAFNFFYQELLELKTHL